MFEREYTRKPSFVQLNCAIRDARAKGATLIQLIWGENQITLEKGPYGWDGRGCIGKTGGYDVAQKINAMGPNMKPTYFGPSVRIAYHGSKPDFDLVVQRFSDVSGDWHDIRTFDHSFDFAWTDARLYAAALSANMRRGVAA